MAEFPLFINDGFTLTKSYPAAAGLHPALTITYRPALDRERKSWAQKKQVGTPDQIVRHETDLFQRQRVVINGEELARLPAEKVDTMLPEVRDAVLNLVLGYAAADGEPEVGKS